jgi:hypothetical protein
MSAEALRAPVGRAQQYPRRCQHRGSEVIYNHVILTLKRALLAPWSWIVALRGVDGVDKLNTLSAVSSLRLADRREVTKARSCAAPSGSMGWRPTI